MLLNCGVGEDAGLPLDCKEIKAFHPKGNQFWIFIGRTDAEAGSAILWPRDVKSWLIGKDPGARKDWRWEEKGMTEDEMVGWHHWLDGHEFEQLLGVGVGQGSLIAVHGVAKSQTRLSNWIESRTWSSLRSFCSQSPCLISWGWVSLAVLEVADVQQVEKLEWEAGVTLWKYIVTSVLPMNIQDWFPLRWTGRISLLSKGFSRVFSNTTVQKQKLFGTQPSL